jgi:hypothetical protein
LRPGVDQHCFLQQKWITLPAPEDRLHPG